MSRGSAPGCSSLAVAVSRTPPRASRCAGEMQSAVQTELDSPPSDGVSSLTFAKHADLLLVTSWDCCVRLYDTALNSCRASFKQRMPVLDAAFLARLLSLEV